MYNAVLDDSGYCFVLFARYCNLSVSLATEGVVWDKYEIGFMNVKILGEASYPFFSNFLAHNRYLLFVQCRLYSVYSAVLDS